LVSAPAGPRGQSPLAIRLSFLTARPAPAALIRYGLVTASADAVLTRRPGTNLNRT
jgi:hypothetical protein